VYSIEKSKWSPIASLPRNGVSFGMCIPIAGVGIIFGGGGAPENQGSDESFYFYLPSSSLSSGLTTVGSTNIPYDSYRQIWLNAPCAIQKGFVAYLHDTTLLVIDPVIRQKDDHSLTSLCKRHNNAETMESEPVTASASSDQIHAGIEAAQQHPDQKHEHGSSTHSCYVWSLSSSILRRLAKAACDSSSTEQDLHVQPSEWTVMPSLPVSAADIAAAVPA
jgi:hypothetical protein